MKTKTKRQTQYAEYRRLRRVVARCEFENRSPDLTRREMRRFVSLMQIFDGNLAALRLYR